MSDSPPCRNDLERSLLAVIQGPALEVPVFEPGQRFFDTPAPIADNEQFLRRAEVVRQTGLSQASIYRLIARGEFPAARHYIGIQGSYWLQSEVTNWKRSQTMAAAA